MSAESSQQLTPEHQHPRGIIGKLSDKTRYSVGTIIPAVFWHGNKWIEKWRLNAAYAEMHGAADGHVNELGRVIADLDREIGQAETDPVRRELLSDGKRDAERIASELHALRRLLAEHSVSGEKGKEKWDTKYRLGFASSKQQLMKALHDIELRHCWRSTNVDGGIDSLASEASFLIHELDRVIYFDRQNELHYIDPENNDREEGDIMNNFVNRMQAFATMLERSTAEIDSAQKDHRFDLRGAAGADMEAVRTSLVESLHQIAHYNFWTEKKLKRDDKIVDTVAQEAEALERKLNRAIQHAGHQHVTLRNPREVLAELRALRERMRHQEEEREDRPDGYRPPNRIGNLGTWVTIINIGRTIRALALTTLLAGTSYYTYSKTTDLFKSDASAQKSSEPGRKDSSAASTARTSTEPAQVQSSKDAEQKELQKQWQRAIEEAREKIRAAESKGNQ